MEERGLRDPEQHASHRASSFSACLGWGWEELILLEPAWTHLRRFGDLLKALSGFFASRSQVREQPLSSEQQRKSTCDSRSQLLSDCLRLLGGGYAASPSLFAYFWGNPVRGRFLCQMQARLSFHTPTTHISEVNISAVTVKVHEDIWLSSDEEFNSWMPSVPGRRPVCVQRQKGERHGW